MKNVLIIGATSAIAEAVSRLYSKSGCNLYLLARNHEKLSNIANDLQVRGASKIYHHTFKATDFSTHHRLLSEVKQVLGSIDIAIIAHGSLPDQKLCEKNFDAALEELNINAISTVSLLTHLANIFEDQRSGIIAVITSVAGDRGRQSNYIYGSAKGMISIFLQGLRNRLFKYGVSVIDIKPGFVDTPMTAHFNKNLLWSKPNEIADFIVNAIERKRNVVYTPFFWKYIMFVIISIPEFLFKRLSL